MQSDLLLTSEVARVAGVSAKTIRVWERTGKLSAQKTATGVRVFSRAQAEQLALERQRAGKGR